MSNHGILNPAVLQSKIQLTRYPPSADLSFFVERYWVVRWDLDTPYTQKTLPYPCFNLVVDKEAARVYGVDTGKFGYEMHGHGHVFGIKFKPGAFYPFLNQNAANLINQAVDMRDIFGTTITLEQATVDYVEDFLRQHLPPQDPQITRINRIIETIINDHSITKVDHLTVDMSKRTLQRLFQQYVGVSPKWVIRRYRLHEAAEQLATQENPDLAKIAHELGYFDQSHFINDFKAMVGLTPMEYAKRNQQFQRV